MRWSDKWQPLASTLHGPKIAVKPITDASPDFLSSENPFVAWGEKTCSCWPSYTIISSKYLNTMSDRPQITALETSDLDTAWRISVEAFASDAHTLFKMHEKGSNDPGSELLPREAMKSYIDKPDKYRSWKASLNGRMVGYTIWGLYNWEGQNSNVSSHSLTRLLNTRILPRAKT